MFYWWFLYSNTEFNVAWMNQGKRAFPRLAKHLLHLLRPFRLFSSQCHLGLNEQILAHTTTAKHNFPSHLWDFQTSASSLSLHSDLYPTSDWPSEDTGFWGRPLSDLINHKSSSQAAGSPSFSAAAALFSSCSFTFLTLSSSCSSLLLLLFPSSARCD